MKRILALFAALALALSLSSTAVAAPAPPSAPASAATEDIGPQQSCFGVSLGAERNPNITGRYTVDFKKTSRGLIELRAGYWKGKLVGWARVVNPRYLMGTVLKVDLNGDRVVDVSCGHDGAFDGVSYLYETSPSSDRAFKACARADSNATAPCHPDHQTGWW